MGEQASMIPVKSEDIVYRRIDDEAVLVPIRRSVKEVESMYTLNGVGSHIWELIDGQRNVESIATIVADEFDVSHLEALSDTFDFVGQLAESGCVSMLDMKTS